MQRTVLCALLCCLLLAVMPVTLAQAQVNKETDARDVISAASSSMADVAATADLRAKDGEEIARAADYEQAISVKYLTLQEGVDPEEAREFMEDEYLQVYRELPGFNVKVGRPDPARMDASDPDFVMIYIFDSKWTRDHYFPRPGVWSDEIHKAIEKNQKTFDELFGVYFIESEYESHEYIMFARAK